ncbi:hypothetical protein FACS1894205_1010 [Alphaproteobacteria bacterium]|nr:hypothetical protein FACS1894205_1010 [Alphaproteobacteria bacterium]
MAAKKSAGKTPNADSSIVRFSVRLLPVTIFVIFLMLSVRVNDIVRGVYGVPIIPVLSTVAEAQQAPPPGGRIAGQATPADSSGAQSGGAANGQPAPAPSSAVSSASSPSLAPAGNGAGAQNAPPAAPPAVPAASSSRGEPPVFTQNEIDVLQKLSERRESLDSRERDISLREQMIAAAESRLDKKIEEMKALQSNMEGMLKTIDEQDERKMRSLVKIYENMKPKEAAKIFNELDLPILLGVLTFMKEQKIALIMEVMDPIKAKELTDAIAQKRGDWIKGQQG